MAPARINSSESGSGCHGACGRSPKVVCVGTWPRGSLRAVRLRVEREREAFSELALSEPGAASERDRGARSERDWEARSDFGESADELPLGRGLRERPRGPLV